MNVNKYLSKPILEYLKKIGFKYFKLGVPEYPYNIEPIQLATIVSELERVKNIDGNILEIGVARGMTSRFICEHLRLSENYTKSIFYAIDTFSSFTQDDLEFEVKNRGKDLHHLKGFAYIDFEVWQDNFKEFKFLKAIKSDCSLLDYKNLSPIKFTFLDVDLYLPTINTLRKVYDATVSGGVIIIDDVLENDIYDGSRQAYKEFCSEKKLEVNIVGNKCGIIYKK